MNNGLITIEQVFSYEERTTSSFPMYLYIEDKNENRVCVFSYNMRGYTASFCLFKIENGVKISYHFQERSMTTQIKELKKAIKQGFNQIQHY